MIWWRTHRSPGTPTEDKKHPARHYSQTMNKVEEVILSDVFTWMQLEMSNLLWESLYKLRFIKPFYFILLFLLYHL